MKKIILLVTIIITVVISFAVFDIGTLLTLGELKEKQAQLQALVDANPFISVMLFFLGYIIATGISIPGALIFTLAGGALFGLLLGTIIISFASSIGALFAFLITRYFLHDFVQNRYSDQFKVINQKIDEEGIYYLLFLRLVPVFPFVLINLTMALTAIRPLTYYWVSQLGMLPATIVYVNAGTQLAKISSADDILSPSVILALVLLGTFPLLSKFIINMLHRQRIYKEYSKPEQFDFNTIVIGGGAAGLVAAYTTRTLQGKVALIEHASMGGDCLNTGCVPSKSILRSANYITGIKNYRALGLSKASYEFEFRDIIHRVHEKISAIEPKDSVNRYTQLGVQCEQGEASLVSPWEVSVDNKILSARNIIIATGAQPSVPDIKGLAEIPYYTTENIWSLDNLPRHLLIIGAGVIGCELGQAFARLGSQVTMVNHASAILSNEDKDAARLVEDALKNDGIQLYHDFVIQDVSGQQDNYAITGLYKGQETRLGFSHMLIATGRKASLTGMTNIGLKTDEHGRLVINDYLQTNIPNIYACGDVASATQYTHSASHQAWYAAFNALFHPFKKFRCSLDNMPRAVFTDPEIAEIGISEHLAVRQGIPHQVTTFPMDEIDRAITDNTTSGFIKVITADNSDKILGVSIVSEHASELIAEFVLAKTHGLGLNKILQTIHIYPTRSEINRMVAGKWRRSRISARTISLLKKYQAWRLGH